MAGYAIDMKKETRNTSRIRRKGSYMSVKNERNAEPIRSEMNAVRFFPFLLVKEPTIQPTSNGGKVYIVIRTPPNSFIPERPSATSGPMVQKNESARLRKNVSISTGNNILPTFPPNTTSAHVLL